MATVQLAWPLKPSSEAFKRIGCKTGEVKGNKIPVTLPNGWNHRNVNGSISTETTVYDEKGRARACSSKVLARYLGYVKNESRLYRRYSIQVIDHHDGHNDGNYEVVLRKIEIPPFEKQDERIYEETVFSAGRTRIEPVYDFNTYSFSPSHPAVRVCMEYANANYPDWLNTEAYWD